MTAVAAYVGSEPVTVADVEQRLARARGSAFGARLPDPSTAEGRNARRWVTQLLCAERIVTAALGRTDRRNDPLTVTRALAVGGVAAAVLSAHPDAARLAQAPPVGDVTARSYYDRNADRYADRGIGWDDARAGIVAELQAVADDRAFADWLERRMRHDVVLQQGFEHPADPRHADATHRH